jgi:hypothetical protein
LPGAADIESRGNEIFCFQSNFNVRGRGAGAFFLEQTGSRK